MVGEKSLQNILNVVAAGLADGSLVPHKKNPDKRTNGCDWNHSIFTEVDAFIALDPLLADLQKRYLDARAQRVQSVNEYGADSPMSDMALWSEESASSAVQTRLVELRANQTTAQGAQDLMSAHAEEERAKEQRAREKDNLKTMEQMRMIARMHETTSGSSSNEAWWMWFALMAMTPEKPFRFYMPSHQFNSLAAA